MYFSPSLDIDLTNGFMFSDILRAVRQNPIERGENERKKRKVDWSRVVRGNMSDRKSTRLNSSHPTTSRMPSSA